jgi:transcription elongation factor Elf1
MTRRRNHAALTADQKRKYVQERFGHCPYCDSESVEGGQLDVDGNHVSQPVACLACHKEWEDVYVLSDIVEGGDDA